MKDQATQNKYVFHILPVKSLYRFAFKIFLGLRDTSLLHLLTTPNLSRDLDVQDLLLLIGRFYQIRDDYMNLASQDVCKSPAQPKDASSPQY